jgi:hypothetical protein
MVVNLQIRKGLLAIDLSLSKGSLSYFGSTLKKPEAGQQDLEKVSIK